MQVGCLCIWLFLSRVCLFTHTTERTAEDLLKSRHLLWHDLNSLTGALARLPEKSQHARIRGDANIHLWGRGGRGGPRKCDSSAQTGGRVEKNREAGWKKSEKWMGRRTMTKGFAEEIKLPILTSPTPTSVLASATLTLMITLILKAPITPPRSTRPLGESLCSQE